jgi:hypothetical protein
VPQVRGPRGQVQVRGVEVSALKPEKARYTARLRLVTGHDFSRAVAAAKSMRALAPVGSLSAVSPFFRSLFSPCALFVLLESILVGSQKYASSKLSSSLTPAHTLLTPHRNAAPQEKKRGADSSPPRFVAAPLQVTAVPELRYPEGIALEWLFP